MLYLHTQVHSVSAGWVR